MLDYSLSELLGLIFILFISFPVHELAHAYTADYFGDDTPRLYGRLTLNPFAHIDLMGALLLLVARFGWAKPVPVNEHTLERTSRFAPALVALAGPVSNLVLGIIGAIPLAAGLVSVQGFTTGGSLPTLGEILILFSFFNF